MNKAEFDRNQRKALGKGLSALLPGKSSTPAKPDSSSGGAAVAEKAVTPPVAKLPEHFDNFESVRLDLIVPGEAQPRTSFEGDKLEELAQSIRTHGVLQPITVSKGAGGKYHIVAGERRWRAAQIAGLTEIPALVRTVEDHDRLELALIENIQREDLNPIETATAFSKLIEQYKLSHEQIAERTGKDRSTITNFLRLLKLPREVQDDLIRGDISMGHARALLALGSAEEQKRVAQQVLDKRLSVRETEKLVKALQQPTAAESGLKGKEIPEPDANVRAALQALESALGTRVRMVQKTSSSGRLEIDYYSQEDIDRIYAVIVG